MMSLIRRLAKPFSSIIPSFILSRIVVKGVISLRLHDSQTIRLYSDGNDQITSSLYWGGIEAFEGKSIKLFSDLLEYSEVVFDIGANVGIYSLIAASKDKHIVVYAFEPVPRIVDRLCRNMIINKLQNIIIIPCALANYDGKINLYIPDRVIPTEASTLKGFREAAEVITVQSRTIDSFVKERQIERVDLLKIDTEGTEHEVLQGSKEILLRDEPIIICEVLKGRTEFYLHQILDELGYVYFWISDKGLVKKKNIEGDPTYRNMNYLFISQRRAQEASPVLRRWIV